MSGGRDAKDPPAPADAGPGDPGAGGERPRRRRRWRLVLVLGALVVLLVVALPWLAAPVVQHVVVGGWDDAVPGRVDLGGLHLGWTGGGFAHLSLTDRRGRPVLDVGAVEASWEAGAALRGEVVGLLRVHAPRLVLRRDEGGALALHDVLPVPDEPSRPRGGGGGGAQGGREAGPAPRVTLHVEVEDGSVELVDADGATTRLSGLDLSLHVPALDRPASLALDGELAGPEGPAGTVHVKGSLTTAPDGVLDPDAARGELTLRLTDVLLAALAPAASVLGAPPPPAGRLGGTVTWTLAGARTGTGEATLAVDDLVLPREDGPPLEVSHLDLTADLRADADGFSATTTTRCPRLSLPLPPPADELLALDELRVDATLESSGERLGFDVAVPRGAGGLTLTGALDPRPAEDAASFVSLQLTDLPVAPAARPLLGLLHPLLAEAGTGAGVEGVVARLGGSLELHVDGPLAALSAPGGPARVLSGQGDLDVSGVGLQASPELARVLGEQAGRQLDLGQTRFTLADGRLSYATPWRWTIDGVPTSFTGSVGLDRTLDLRWEIPVDEALVAEKPKLEPLLGQTLVLPVTGTVEHPELPWEAAVADLLQRAAADRLQQAVEDPLSELRDALGGAGAEAAADLLQRADALWEQGDKAAAKALYRELKDEHRYTLAYQLDEERIKERARWKPNQDG